MALSSSPPPPVFVVGAPRSGTTLLAAMLSAHSRLSCGPETGFFAALARERASDLVAKSRWPDPAVRFLSGLELGGEAVVSRYLLEPEQIREFLLARPPSVAAMLASLTEQFMLREEKTRWIEKSPIHLLWAERIREHFPRSPIVRIVRDPRDVARSVTRVPWGPDSVAGALLYWRRFDEGSSSFFDRDPLTHTLYYEELVERPGEVLGRLCDFLGEAFEPEMLEFQQSARNVRRSNEAWKGNVGRPLDRGRAQAWRESLSAAERSLAFSLVGDRLACHGYDAGVAAVDDYRYARLLPLHERIESFPQIVRWIEEKGLRLWRARPGERPVAQLFVGHPDLDHWLGTGRGARIATTFDIVADSVRARLSGKPLLWLREPAPEQRWGFCARVVRLALTGSDTVSEAELSHHLGTGSAGNPTALGEDVR